METFIPGMYVVDMFGRVDKFANYCIDDDEFVMVEGIVAGAISINMVNKRALRPFWIQPDDTIKLIDKKTGIMFKMIEVHAIRLEPDTKEMYLGDEYGIYYFESQYKFEI